MIKRLRHTEGQALVEFAVVVIVILLLLCGFISFGTAFSNDITLTQATSNAAQAVGAGAGTGTTVDPCAEANAAFIAAASALNSPASSSQALSFTIYALTNGAATNQTETYQVSSSGGPSCPSFASDMSQYQQVEVVATYTPSLPYLKFLGVNSAPTLTAQSTEAVQ